MPCLNGDGSLTVVAGAILDAMATASEPADVAAATGLPLYRVRGGLREMAESGLVEPNGAGYSLTARGRTLLTLAHDGSSSY
jgi:DNA-binding IclR family transcriptional regulator